MKIVFCAMGDLNEIQPFITIANYLNNQNHDVVVVTNSNYKELCELYNLTFVNLNIDYDDVVKNKLSNIDIQLNTRRYVKTYKKQVSGMFPVLIDNCKDADYVFYNTSIVGITDISEMYGFNLIKMSSFPFFYPSKKLKNPLNSNSVNIQFNKELTYNNRLERNVIAIINNAREFYFQKEKRRSDIFKYDINGRTIKHILVNSKYIYDEDLYPDDENIIMSGFLTFPAIKTLDDEILQYLVKYPRPIVVNLRYTNVTNIENFIRAIKATSDKLEDSGVIILGDVKEQTKLKFKTVFFTSDESLKLLTSYARVYIHNGDLSSYVAAFEAKCVSSAVVKTTEQKFFTELFESKELILPRINNNNNITSEKILKHIKDLETPELIQNIEKLSINLATEDVLTEIENFVFDKE